MTFDPRQIRWNGALTVERSRATSMHPGVALCQLPLPSKFEAPLVSWIRDVLPAESQNGPSCVGQAWANWLETMLRRWARDRVPIGRWQLDGERVWKRARDMFWASDYTSGLYPSQGFAALVDLGWIPPDAILRKIPSDWASIGVQLLDTPICMGLQVHAGWYRPDPKNGCLDHQPEPTEADGYHETLLIGRMVQGTVGLPMSRFYQGLNSWGEAWGWRGCFVLRETELDEGLMPDGLFTAHVEGLAEWSGWRDGVRMV